MIRATVSAEAGNKMVKDPNGLKLLEDYISKIKAEASYFYEEDGDRTFLFIADMASADMIPVFAEPLFQGLNAKVEFHPAMTLDDVKRGIQKAR